MKLFKQGTLAAKWAMGILLVSLVLLVISKPRVESGFHTDYVNALNRMQPLTGELLRDHLMVRHGLVKHYDFLEANLEKMERAVQVVGYFPGFTGREYQQQGRELLKQYSSMVSELREYVETSKRSIGLLKNSSLTFRRYLGELDRMPGVGNSAEAVVLLNEMNYLLVYQDLDTQWLEKAERLQFMEPATAVFIRPLILHARMILVQQENLLASSVSMYALLDEMKQPDLLKASYLKEYYATVKITDALLWLSYAIVVVLLALCGVLIVGSRKAQEQSERDTLLAQKAQAQLEQKAGETKLAVSQCIEVLARIGKGDFEHRLSGPFDEELEELRMGINDTADGVEYTMQELTRVMQAIEEGHFSARLDSRIKGNFGQQIDQTIETLDKTIGDICRVMDNMRDGCFESRVEASCSGRLEELKSAVNGSMFVLESAITTVVDMTEHQSRGDFSRQIQTNGKGKLKLLEKSINATSAKIHEMVREIRQVSGTVADSSDSMQSNSKQLWEHTAFHGKAVAKLLESIDEIKASIQSNRDSVELATSLVGCSRQAADTGVGIANEAVVLMGNINDKSQKVNTITQVLDAIAKQTNLLALNAAVEAARANEHGSGFTVVANEVKQLARQSSEASTDINALIQATLQDITSGVQTVENTGQALQNIGLSISDVEQVTSTILEQSRQQEQGVDRIVEIVSKALLVIDMDLELADTTCETSVSLGELAHKMNEMLTFFKGGEREAQDGQEQTDQQSAGILGKAA